MALSRPLAVYAGEAVGAYGWEEKPWYRPGDRLGAFVAELERRGLGDRVDWREAGLASDAELKRFHTPTHLHRVRARCATNRGSLDCAVPAIVDDARRVLVAIGEHASIEAVRAAVGDQLVPSMDLDGYLGYLETEGLAQVEGDRVRRTVAGAAFATHHAPWLNGPTFARSSVEKAARAVAGAVLDATGRILDGELKTAFLPISGFHHALPDAARMYCLYNDPGLALALAVERVDGPVAYVDIDIHQGDGVYAGFAEEPRVVAVDLHEDWSTLFPHTPECPGEGPFSGRAADRGIGAGKGSKLNLPLAPGTDDAAFLARWEEAEAFLRARRPRFVVFEAGVDGLGDDPMSHQRITEAAIVEVARRVRALAEEHADGRLLVLGGGGYALEPTARAWVSVVEALLES